MDFARANKANGAKPQFAPPRQQGPPKPLRVQEANGPKYNTRNAVSNMKDSIWSGYNKVYDSISSASYTLQISLVILGILVVLIVMYVIIGYYSYQVNVQQLISVGRSVDLSKIMTSEQYSISNNGDNRLSTAFWLFTHGSNQGTAIPVQLLRYARNYSDTETLTYDSLNNDSYGKLKTNLVGAPIYTSSSRTDLSDDKMVVTLYGNDLIIMIKPVSNSNNYIYMTVDYLPLSIWNHIAIIVDSEYLSIYLNGEIYKTQSIRTIESVTQQPLSRMDTGFNSVILLPNIQRATMDPSVLENSYMAQLVFTDDSLSAVQVQSLYDQSPYGSTLLSKIGYGLRSPVYKIDDGSS